MPGTGNSGGHNAKTVGRLIADGTYRDDRHAGVKNPTPPSGRPDAPRDLDGEALAEWYRMVDRLEMSGSLSKVDDSAIYQYAKLFAETKQLEKEANRTRKLADKLTKAADKLDGKDFVAALHEIAALEQLSSKHVIHLRQGRMSIRQYLVEFGMTPSSRGRVRLSDGAQKPGGKLMSFRGGKEA